MIISLNFTAYAENADNFLTLTRILLEYGFFVDNCWKKFEGSAFQQKNLYLKKKRCFIMKSNQFVFSLNSFETNNFMDCIKRKIKCIFVKYYFKRGLLMKDKGDLFGALYFFKQVIKIDPRNINALNNLGVCCAEMGMYKESLNYLGRACAIKFDVDIIINMIVSSVKAGKKSVANYCCNKLEKHINKLDACTLFNLAELMVHGKNYERALYYYDLCIKRDQTFKIKATHKKGICYVKLGRINDAQTCVEILFNEEQGKKLGWELKGFIFDHLNFYAEAVDCYNKAYGFE
ncbi:MAG TPA: hypothetical protein DEA47_01210 [Peptococcaceae bacterium]|nr:hypothetical protein [Peptococcaceae bacterium]